MVEFSLGFNEAPDAVAQQPAQQPVPGGIFAAFGAPEEESSGGIDANLLGTMTTAERAVYLANQGLNSATITAIQEGFENTSLENEALANSLELKGHIEAIGIDPYNLNPEVSSRGNPDGAAGLNALITGSANSEAGTIRQAIGTLSGEASNQSITTRRLIVAKNYQEAYESLKGGGQITEYEGKTMANALNRIGDPSLTDAQFRQELESLYKRLHRVQQLAERNIRVNQNTGEEFIYDPNSNERTRVVSFFNEATGDLDFVPLDDINTPIEVPSYLSAKDLALFKASIPVGQQFSFTDANGETHIMTKSKPFNLPTPE